MKYQTLTGLSLILLSCGLGACTQATDGEGAADDSASAGSANGSFNSASGGSANGSGGAGNGPASGGTSNGTAKGGTSNAGGSAGAGAGGDAGSGPEEPKKPVDPSLPYSVEAFAYVDPNPADYHPLSSPDTTLVRNEEIRIFRNSVINYTTPLAGWMIDDARRNRALPAQNLVTPGLTGHVMWDATHGDLDGNGVPEAVLASLYEVYGDTFKKLDHIQISAYGKPGTAPETITLGGSGEGFTRVSLASGDVDGDGDDEILVAAMTGMRFVYDNATESTGGRLYVIDRTAQGLETILTRDYQNVRDLAVVTGNLDDDPAAELAVHTWDRPNYNQMQRSILTFLDYANGSVSEIANVTRTTFNEIEQTSLVTANLDADATDEIVSVQPSESRIYLTRYDRQDSGFVSTGIDLNGLWATSFRYVPNPYADPFQGGTGAATHNLTAVAGDFNGDGHDDIALLALEEGQPIAFGPGAEQSWTLRIVDVARSNVDRFDVATGGLAHMAAIHDDFDSAQELAVVHAGSSGIRYFRYDQQTYSWDSFKELYVGGGGDIPGDGWPLVTCADFDGDNMVVRYTGDHRFELAAPVVLVALAAPPVQAGIDQVYDWSETRYGVETGESTSESKEISVSLGITLSWEVEDPLKIVSGEMSASLDAEFSKTKTKTTNHARGVNYGTSAAENSVVFLGSLYHAYTYEVLVAEDPTLVGTFMDINVPVANNVYKWPVERFNTRFPHPDLKIGTETFTNEPFDVKSYPNVDKRNELIAMSDLFCKSGVTRCLSTEATVGLGGSTTGLSLTFSDEEAEATSYGFNVGFEHGAAVVGVGVSYRAGFGYTNSVEVTVGKTSTYSGAVGDIGPADYDAYQYSFGLFLHEVVRANHARYYVVNYWVNNLGPAYGN